jgi:hypothetical protein
MCDDRHRQGRRRGLDPGRPRRAHPRRTLDFHLALRVYDGAQRFPDRGGGVLPGRHLRQIRRACRLNVYTLRMSVLRLQSTAMQEGDNSGSAQQGPGADCLQRPLVPRSRFQQQLRPGVRLQLERGASIQDSECRATANRSSAYRNDRPGLLVCPSGLRWRSNAWGDAT